ncbi:SDR family oxidoreductase [soil metagenome]
MAIDLRGKVIAISGASSGIGAATAIECARAGMKVALGARRLERLQTLAERIRRDGGEALAVQLDVADAPACVAFIAQTVEMFGGLHAVFANAGYGVEQSMIEMPEAELRQIFEVNFFGSLNLVRPAVKHMLAQPAPAHGARRGHVLICSSCLAKMTIPFYGAYSATKAAQHHVGQALRLELEPKGIAVTTVHPISTESEFFDAVKRVSGTESLSHSSPGIMTQTPAFVGKRVVARLKRPRPELWPGVRGVMVRTGMSLSALLPGTTDFVLRGMVKRRFRREEREGKGHV